MTPQLFTQPNYPSTNNFVPHINTSFFFLYYQYFLFRALSPVPHLYQNHWYVPTHLWQLRLCCHVPTPVPSPLSAWLSCTYSPLACNVMPPDYLLQLPTPLSAWLPCAYHLCQLGPAAMCLPQRHHLCQHCCHVPTHHWPAMSAARLLPQLHSPLTALVCCHVPTTSDSMVLLPCAFTSVSTAAMCLLFTGLQCDCRQVAALSALISDNPHMLSCASPNRTHQASDYWVHFLNYKARLYYSVLSNNLVMPTTSTAGRKIKVVIYYVCLHKLFSVWSSLFLHATIHFHKELIPALVIFYVYSMQSSYFSIFFKLIYSKLIYLLFNNFIS